MPEDADFIILATIILIIGFFQLLKIDIKSQFGYYSSQYLAYLSDFDLINEIRNAFGSTIYLILSFVVYTLFIKIFNSISPNFNSSDIDNPYLVRIGYKTERFLFSCGFFEFMGNFHPSIESVIPLELLNDGSIKVTQHSMDFIHDLSILLQILQENPFIRFILVKMKSQSRRYQKFSLLAYVLQDENEKDNRLFAIEKLQMIQPRFKRLRLNEVSKRKISKLIRYDPIHKEINFNYKVLQKGFDIPFYELEIHEFEAFTQLIDVYNKNTSSIDLFHDRYYLGRDLLNRPVYVDDPQNMLCVGSSQLLKQFISAEFVTNPVLITDDEKLIRQLRHFHSDQKTMRNNTRLTNMTNYLQPINTKIRYYLKNLILKLHRPPEKNTEEDAIQDEVTDEDILHPDMVTSDNLHLNFIELYATRPRFFRMCINLWEQYLPSSAKTRSMRDNISSSILEYLELQYLLDAYGFSRKVTMKSLMEKKSYREFNQDISTQVFTKFNGIFNLALFDPITPASITTKQNSVQRKIPFQRFIREFEDTPLKIISLENLDYRKKQALFIMLLLMTDQAVFPDNWFIFSFKEEHNIEYLTSILSRSIGFHNVIMHFRSIGNTGQWINNFSLHLLDSGHPNERLKNYLFNDFPPVEKAVFMRKNVDETSILRFVEDT